MNHVAEITTPSGTTIMKFALPDDCETVEAILGELADDGLIYGLEFYTDQ